MKATALILFLIYWTSFALAQTTLVARAETFAEGKAYKLNPTPAERGDGKFDCTSFVQAVLDQAGFNVGGKTGAKINIVLNGADASRLKELVERRDNKIKGVVTALVESGQGSEITGITNLKSGDIIQMWRFVQDSPQGHTGFVKAVDVASKTVTLVGAHVDGVGSKQFKLDSARGYPIWFAVRPGK